MSGIYGVISKKNIDKSFYKGLAVWNNNYGDMEPQEYEAEKVFLGIKPENLKKSEDDRRLFSENDKVGVFDTLIYSEKNTEYTDECYLYKKVCDQGTTGIKEVNGDFAGALFDIKENKLTLFRDHMGVRPLFYYADKDRVIFSTDMRGILSVEDIDTAVDEWWLYEKLTVGGGLFATDTEYAHIKCVPFGGSITFSFEGDEIRQTENRYFVPGQKKIRLKNKEAYTKELRRLVEDAVRIRAEATDLPLGAELSGGLDSGVIDLLLAKMGKECRYYSWTPGEDVLPLAQNDERLIINDICEKAGITCNYGGLEINWGKDTPIYKRTPMDMEKYSDYHYSIRYAFPLYVNTPQIFGTATYMKSNGVKLIMTGHGGDEGISHRSNPYELWNYHEYYRYLRLMYSRSSVDKHRIKKTIELIRENQKIASTKLKKPFVSKHHEGYIAGTELTKKFAKRPLDILSFAFDPISYVRNGGSRNRLDVLAFYSSVTGVRYMVPYLDYRVLEFALGIPRYLYHNWYYNRFIFREAFKDLMPQSLYKQKIKEDMSYRNLPRKEEETESLDRKSREMIEIRRKNLNYIDRSYWQQYLDYDLLESWVKGETDPEYDGGIYAALTSCIQVEHLVKRSREVNNT